MSAPGRVGVHTALDPETATLTVRVRGDLDDAGGSELIAVVVAHLSGPTPPRTVRLDFGELADIDPLGLAALLMIRRNTGAARAVLHLDNRPTALDRLLRQTNVLGHLTARDAAGAVQGTPGTGLPHGPYGG